MPLILPVLRVFWVFSIVFESFKTLKLPPPSSRNGGHPTVRAMSQRKRAMKGCMTVWLVWCCFATYERTLDGFIGLFIPFYSEIKSLVILFFLLTRARGAEPIYLHVLRPLVKPYVATLDVLLDVTHSVGDFILLLANIPLDFLRSFYRPTGTRTLQSDSDEDRNLYPPVSSAPSSPRNAQFSTDRMANGGSSSGEPTETVHGAVRARRRPLEAAHATNGATRPPASSSRSSSRTRQQPQATRSRVEVQPHEIWVPPQAAYDDAQGSGLPTPPREEPMPLEQGEKVANIPEDDWRKYEAFPSAYPPTPLVSTSRLPSDRAAREEMTAISEEPHLDEPGDWRQYEAFPSAYPATPLNKPAKLPANGYPSLHHQLGRVPEESTDPEVMLLEDDQQDFQGSLELPREFHNPDSAGDSSDDRENIYGVHHNTNIVAEEAMDIDSSDGDYKDEDEHEDEDDFDVTLQTPARISRLENISKASSTRTDTSTGLSTEDNGSPLRTRTNSEASTLLNDSDSSSLAGRKRALPFPGERVRSRSIRLRGPTHVPSKRGDKAAAVIDLTDSRAVIPPQRHTKASSVIEEIETEASDAASVTVKKRRIAPLQPAAAKQERPHLSRRSTSDRTISGLGVSIRSTPASTTTSNARSVQPNARHSQVSTSQPSIRSGKRLGVRTEHPASVGDAPALKQNHATVMSTAARGHSRR